MQTEGQPAILREGIFQIQICVPKTWSDEDAERWINAVNHCGTTKGWTIEEGSEDSPKRVQCAQFTTHEHILFNA